MDSERKRTVNFSQEEQQVMVHKIAEFQAILYDENIQKATEVKCWQMVADAVQAVRGITRSYHQIHKKAGKFRSDAKSKAAKSAKYINLYIRSKTGGGISEDENLDEFESTMLQTLPKVAYSGISSAIDTSGGKLNINT